MLHKEIFIYLTEYKAKSRKYWGMFKVRKNKDKEKWFQQIEHMQVPKVIENLFIFMYNLLHE